MSYHTSMRILSALVAFIFIFTACTGNTNNQNTSSSLGQTLVEQAEQKMDKNGVPLLDIEGVGEVYHPARVASYALQYAGVEAFFEPEVEPDQTKMVNCINWIKKNCTKRQASAYWEYPFDNTYNDVSIQAPWSSAFGQALAIEALVECYNQTKDAEALELAKQGAQALFTPIAQGGLLFEQGDAVWFEEIPSADNPSHILNGHMRALIALQKLYQASSDSLYQEWYDRGASSLSAWLPQYDTGYWLRYDLNPQKEELLFRFNNRYGFSLVDLPIDKIVLTDPLSGKSVQVDVGVQNDAAEGQPRISGNDWQRVEVLDGRTIRRLSPVNPADSTKQLSGEMVAPYTYFYLNLPGEWKDNLRTDWFDMTIIYKDEKPGNLNVQMRSIAPGNAFVDMRDGDLLLTGSGEWREWKIPVRTSDLGWWTGEVYGEKHLQYLKWLADYTPAFEPWADVMHGYLNSNKPMEAPQIKSVKREELPEQLPMLPFYSLDETGVIRFHLADEKTEFYPDGTWKSSSIGEPVYSPYIIAEQALTADKRYATGLMDLRTNTLDQQLLKQYDWLFPDNISRVQKAPAFKWLEKNAKPLNDSLIWVFDFGNCYNDVVQQPGWQSAFSQRYVIDAYMSIDDKNTVLKAAYAYGYSTEMGGLHSQSKSKDIWYEEVPNNSHILNAHLASLVALDRVNKSYPDSRAHRLYQSGMTALENNLYRFDTGYWSKYDMNPKKEMLLQLDWLNGDASPLVDEVLLYNPVSNTATQIDVGDTNDFEGYPNVAGTDWTGAQTVDGKSVRGFSNGYAVRAEAVQGGARHNVFLNVALPERDFVDFFDLPEHQLVIRYKDVAQGDFVVKSQSINEGNFLDFSPLANGQIHCVGDGQWKTAVVPLRPQDTGWYMGPDYQIYHNEQLKLLADAEDSWLLRQYVEKWDYYLECYQSGKRVVVEPSTMEENAIKDVRVISSSAAYEGFDLANALDGDPNDDYVAFAENEINQYFELGFSATQVSGMELHFESVANFLSDYEITFFLEGNEVHKVEVLGESLAEQRIQFDQIQTDKIRIDAKAFTGQQRVLLRQITVYERSQR